MTTERPPSASSAAMAPPPAPEPTTTTSASTVRSGLSAISLKLVTMTLQPLGADQLGVLLDGVAEERADARIGVPGHEHQALHPFDQIAPQPPARVHPAVDVARATGGRQQRERHQRREQ